MKSYLVQHYLNNTAKHYPKKMAIFTRSQSITFGELEAWSNQLARFLIKNGVERQDRVIICLPRSVHYMISIFGILKADAIYVPVDNEIPRDRLNEIIKDSQPKAIIFDEKSFSKNQVLMDAKDCCLQITVNSNEIAIINSDGESSIVDPDSLSDELPGYQNIDTDVAYILYTSGSTGKPKGVMISHLNIDNYISWGLDYFSITQDDKILCTAPFHFDMSTFDIYCAVRSGATLTLALKMDLLFPGSLFDLIEKEGLTIWKGVASLLMYIARSGILQDSRIPSLSRIIFGGEVLSAKYLSEWMHIFPDKSFFNGYGPTEATGLSSCYEVNEIPKDSSDIIPIGQPCSNSECMVLTPEGTRVPPGEKGELCIMGSCLSPGYWNDAEATKKAFRENNFTKSRMDRYYKTGDIARVRPDGNLEFICREDDQIKFMGYRIELSDIENALLSINSVKDTAVILSQTEEYGVSEIVAFIEVDRDVNEENIKIELKEKLPIHMIPKKMILVEKLPRTDRGKINKKMLKE